MEALQLSHRLHKLGLRRNYSLLRLLDKTLLGCGPTDWYSSRPFSFCSPASYSAFNFAWSAAGIANFCLVGQPSTKA
jgi:hypothetical protein